jgi:hypothetical protein
MKRAIRLAVLSLVCCVVQSTWGQATLIDQSRSISTDSQNDSTTAAGGYNNSVSFSDHGTYSLGVGNSETLANDGASQQNSTVSSAALSGDGSVSVSTKIVANIPQIITQLASQSIYDVDFSVASPTLFTLSGDITGSGTYHLGPLETIEANVTFSQVGQSTPLYSASEAFGSSTGLTIYSQNFSFNDPVSFSTTLQPGQIYTLNAQAYNSALRTTSGGGSFLAPASAAFSFTASVPEPTAFSLLALAIPFASRRKIRR